MRRIIVMTAVLGLLAVACGADPAAAPSTSATSPSTTTAGSTSTRAPTPATEPPQSATPNGPAAPDFVLELANGGSFALSQETKPVYMVFWAEW